MSAEFTVSYDSSFESPVITIKDPGMNNWSHIKCDNGVQYCFSHFMDGSFEDSVTVHFIHRKDMSMIITIVYATIDGSMSHCRVE